MHCVYLLTFIDRIKDDTPPFYYIGSKSNYTLVDDILLDKNNKEYWGSSLSEVFIEAKKDSNINVKILGDFDSYREALLYEKKCHEENDVVASTEYFNKSVATISTYTDPNYATYKNIVTGKCVRLQRDHPRVLCGEYVGVTAGFNVYNNGISERHAVSHPGEGWEIGRLPGRMTGENNSFYGKKHTSGTKSVMSEKARQRHEDNPELKQILSERAKKTFAGVPKSDAHKNKIGRTGLIMLKNLETGKSIRIKKEDKFQYDDIWVSPYSYTLTKNKENNIVAICPHCNYTSTPSSTMKRWHFDNCKNRKNHEN